jgi:hypothetical protein
MAEQYARRVGAIDELQDCEDRIGVADIFQVVLSARSRQQGSPMK